MGLLEDARLQRRGPDAPHGAVTLGPGGRFALPQAIADHMSEEAVLALAEIGDSEYASAKLRRVHRSSGYAFPLSPNFLV